jgi:choline dehydrogenase-like flavoprotein
MRIFDLSNLQDNSPIETDLCIVGTGPAGISLANEFTNQNIRVLLLESGGFDQEPSTHSLYDIESIAPRKIDQKDIRCRVLGGSSRIWTGRCAPFDALDFEERSWIPYSGWPLSLGDLAPYLERAGVNLGLGPNCYDETLWHHFGVQRPLPPLDPRFLEPKFWQFSRSPRDQKVSTDFGRDILNADSEHIEVLLHANLTHINISADGGRFESADVRTLDGKAALIKSKALVLCCGGIENARLLLASNRSFPKGIGNQNDMVGRFLMDHTDSVIWNLHQNDAHQLLNRFGAYWLDSERGRHVFLHGIGLSREVQEKEYLLNCHAYIDQFGALDDDPWPALRRVGSALRLRSDSDFSRRDALIVLQNVAAISKGLYRRRVEHRPPLIRTKRYELHCILEQVPDPKSRVTLSEEKRDALGMPLSKIDWKISDSERKTARRMSRLLAKEFARLGLPVPDVPKWLDDQSAWPARCVEKAHPSGTTRMSHNAKDSVVDENCQVHGVKGLFVSGSSVFPTSGAANPTLMIVAMSLRLADWLKVNCFGPSIRSEVITSSSLSGRYRKEQQDGASSAVIELGFVGSGSRIREMYLPILQQLSAKYRIVGFTTGSAESSERFESETGIKAFSNASEMVRRQKPQLIITAVPDGVNERVVTHLIDLGVPILAETPLAWSASGARKIIRKAAAKKVLIGVSEQFPFLPIEQFRKKLIDLGVFGNIYAAFNDFHSYSYHGIAQLRRYIKGHPQYVRNFDVRSEYGVHYQSGSVLFSDGAELKHNYTILGQSLRPSVHFHGTKGAMIDNEITVINKESNQDETILVSREKNSSGNLRSISATLPGFGEVRWLNPFVEFPLSDEQIAVATLLEGMSMAILNGTQPVYTAGEFVSDIEIVQALRYSANANGRRIRLPLLEKMQMALSLTAPSYWKRRISE